ncbi:MAG: hypothetical protein HQL96_16635 [Magnetococcales bacterium]|nr:hypothetical protein [Magnetococcales bacterium]
MATLRSIESGDSPALAAFCATFPGETRPESYWRDRFRFWWEENPHCPTEFPRGSLLESETGIGGMFALIPTPLQLAGEERLAANMSNWRVLPDMRKQSFAMFMHIMEMAKPYPVFNTTPTTTVEAILKRVPFLHFTSAIRQETVLLSQPSTMDPARGLREVFRMARNWSGDWNEKALPLSLARTLGRYSRQWAQTRSAMTGTGDFYRATTIGPEFDRLWARTRNRHVMTNVRSAKALEWYIQRNPQCQEYFLLVHATEGEVRGYGLFKRKATKHWPDTESLLAVDLWGEYDEARKWRPLLAYAMTFARGLDIHVVRIPHYHAEMELALRGCGFLHPLPTLATGYYHPPAGMAPPAPEEIHASGNMGDVGL